MNTKSVFWGALLASLLIICTGCGGCDGFGECIGGGEHYFEQKVLFEPEQFQYFIGDTIWLSTKFSCLDMLNSVTRVQEDYCGLKSMEVSFQILNIGHHLPADSIPYIYSFQNFDIVGVEGTVKPYNYSSQSIFFQINNNEYSFKVALVPKVIGKYVAFISDSGPVRLSGSDRCDTGGFGFSNGNENNNILLLEAYSGQGQVSDYERTHAFCFEVIE